MASITGSTQLLGVMGCPIQHSLSPVLHNAALAFRAEQLGRSTLDFVYLPLSIEPPRLATAIAGLTAIGWQGFNVTLPHKQAIMQYLDQVTPLAQAVGAVNTVWRQDQQWRGTNTDVQGFLAPLLALKRDWAKTEACILGSGGAARAVIAGCAQLGCAAIHVVARQLPKLQALQASFASLNPPIAIQTHLWSDLAQLLPQTALLVNTTPVGMHPNLEATPLEAEAIARLPPTSIVYDLIYTPRPTQLLAIAKQQNHLTFDGLEMLIQQGAAAFELWLHEKPHLPAMRQAALAQLER